MLLFWQGITAQVKLGTNFGDIHPASLLELESPDQALVITRVDTGEMELIEPLKGALVYNTDEDCLFYFDGEGWINLCEALGLLFTSEPIENEFPTMLITRVGDSINFEVGRIKGGDDTVSTNNIEDFSIVPRDILGNSIGAAQLARWSVESDEIFPGAVTPEKIFAGKDGQVLTTSIAGGVTQAKWSYPSVVAWGKWTGGDVANEFGINITNISEGEYRVTFVNLGARVLNKNYTIQLTPVGDYRIFVSEQNTDSFTISVRDVETGNPINATGFFVTVFDN